MQKIKILALLTAAFLMLGCFVGCSNGPEEETGAQISVHLTITGGYDEESEEEIFDDDVITTTTNVYSLVKEICTAMNIAYSDDGNYTYTSFANYPEMEYEGLSYFWNFTVNGSERRGNSHDVALKEGDTVVYFIDSFEVKQTGDTDDLLESDSVDA